MPGQVPGDVLAGAPDLVGPAGIGAGVPGGLYRLYRRQEILTREDPLPPILWVLLDENALTRQVGSPRIMHDQLMHLAQAARQPNVTVQVIPCTVVHPGLLGAFAIAELDGMSPIVYLETGHDGQTLEDPDVGARMSVRFDGLRTEALTGRASLSLIEKVAEERWNT